MTRILTLLCLLLAAPGSAHDGSDHGSPGWSFEPLVVGPLLLLLLLFFVGQKRIEQRSRVPRKGSWQFLAGWTVLSLSLVSPLHEGGEQSFTLHMIEHELIMLVATLLLASSKAGGAVAWGLPLAMRTSLGGWTGALRQIYRRLTEPVTATIVQAAVMWAWHIPSLFDRTLESQGWHVAQHLSFILASFLFWASMFDHRRSSPALAAGCLFATSLIEGALGALMTLSSSPWYASYAAMQLTGIGLDPLVDQQLAGLIMWIPGGLLHGAVALALLYSMLKSGRGTGAPTSR